jgi:glycosyltransferase involved in cell wall biosynthesis
MVHNESCAQIARERGGLDERRISIVGVGPDPARIFATPPREELKKGRRYLVVWVGHMSRQEGMEHLLDAAEHVVRRRGRRDVLFTIIGPGDERPRLEADVRRRGLGEHIEFTGPLTDPELLRAYIATADVCLSVDERNDMNDKSTMMKVLEYMAMGRPVVQFPLTEMQRLCGDATLYARNADPADLGNQVVALLDDPERREELGAHGRQRLLSEGLMWDQQAPALVETVERAITVARARRRKRRSLRRRPAATGDSVRR